MSIKERLTIIVPRETSGSDTYRRYQFQIACAMELIIKLANTSKEFMTLMDYLDDIVLIENGCEDDSLVTFYQVKSKDCGTISINTIIKNEWIEKMYYNLNELNDNAAKAVLLSNTGFGFCNGNVVSSVDIISLSDYIKEKKLSKINDTIINNLASSFKLEKENIKYDNIYLLRTNLTLNDYERQLKGELQNLAKSLYPTLTADSLETIYLKIKDMLSERQAKVLEEPTNYETLCEQKGFSSKQFNQVLRVTKDVQLPDVNELRRFATDNKINIEGYHNTIEFNHNYNLFSEDLLVYNLPLIKSIFSLLDNHKEDILLIKQENLLSFCINIIDSSDYGTATFYSKNKHLIVLLYLYKRSEGK